MKSLALPFLLAAVLSAQGLDQGKPIVDKALAALGGDRFLQMQNRAEYGRVYSFFHDQLSGLDLAHIYTEYLAAQPKNGLAIRERQVFGKHQDYSVLFFPDQAWDLTFRGARPIPDENWQRFFQTTETNIFYILRCRLNEPGLEFDYIGNEVLNNAQTKVVEITDTKHRTVRIYFDHITMYPVRQTYRSIDPDTKYHNEEITDYDKYRDAGNGIMWPLAIHRERNGYKTFEIFAERVEVNKTLPEKTFELPPGVKLLKKVE